MKTKNEILNTDDCTFFKPSELGVTSRQINLWIDNSVVLFVDKKQKSSNKSNAPKIKNKWIRLNFSQSIWVFIVKDLLRYGVSIKDLKKFSESIWIKDKKSINDLNTIEQYVSQLFKDKKQNAFLVYEPELKIFHFFDLCTKSKFYFNTENQSIIIPLSPLFKKLFYIDFINTEKELKYIPKRARDIRQIYLNNLDQDFKLVLMSENDSTTIVLKKNESGLKLSNHILENNTSNTIQTNIILKE